MSFLPVTHGRGILFVVAAVLFFKGVEDLISQYIPVNGYFLIILGVIVYFVSRRV